MTNSYTIEKSDINFSGGRYLSANPYNAAKKAANQLFRKIKNDKKYNKFKSSKALKFTLRETTANSNKKEFTYKATRVKLDKPIKINIKGREIIYNYKIDITSMNMHTNISSQKGGDGCPRDPSKIPFYNKKPDTLSDIHNIFDYSKDVSCDADGTGIGCFNMNIDSAHLHRPAISMYDAKLALKNDGGTITSPGWNMSGGCGSTSGGSCSLP